MRTTDTELVVETAPEDGTWVVRVGAVEVGRHGLRPAAVDVGRALAAELGLVHAVRYASAGARPLVPAR